MVKDSHSRKGMLFGAIGLAVGVAAGAMGMLSLRGGDGPYASMPAATRSMGAGPSTTAFFTAVSGNCELSPLLPKAGDGDGRERLQDKPGAASADEVGALILSGKEAAASGRQRDAEVDFLNACRNAALLPEGDLIPLADAMYQLARHYANVGAFGAADKGKDLFQRAERLYSASLEAYRARYGEEHEKTKFAREGLATVQHATGGKAPAAIAKAPPEPVAPPAAPETAVLSAPPAPPVAEPPREVAKAPEAPRAKARELPAAAPVKEPEVAAVKEPAASTEAKAPAPQRPATEARRPERDAAEPVAASTEEAPRPRVVTRRVAPADSPAADPGADVALDAPAPPPRRPRPAPAPVQSAEPPAAETPVTAPSEPATATGSVGDVGPAYSGPQ